MRIVPPRELETLLRHGYTGGVSEGLVFRAAALLTPQTIAQ
jgi:hypothetical protein